MYYTLEQTFDWLQEQLTRQPAPFMGYIHVFPPHDPYRAREDFIGKFDDDWKPVSKPKDFFTEGWDEAELLRHRLHYDEFLAYADAEFGRLYDFMKQSGLLENTCLVVTSDHGEMFERGILAHQTPSMFQPLLHIPLLMALPGQNKRQDIRISTSSVDVLPTLLHIAGQDVPEWCEGQALPLYGTDSSTDRNLFALEAKLNSKEGPLHTISLVLFKGQYKLVHYLGYPGYEDVHELYDLENDPEELHNLYQPGDALSRSLQEELAGKLVEINKSEQISE